MFTAISVYCMSFRVMSVDFATMFGAVWVYTRSAM